MPRFKFALRGAFARQIERKLIKRDTLKTQKAATCVPRFKFALRGAFARQIERKLIKRDEA